MKKILYNVFTLTLYLGGLVVFLLRFSMVSFLIASLNDPKFESDYWLDQPLVVYAGFIVTYVIHWFLILWGRKHLQVSKAIIWFYFVLDMLVILCGTFWSNVILVTLISKFITGEYGFTKKDISMALFGYCPNFLPQQIICLVLLLCRIRFTKRTLKKMKNSTEDLEKTKPGDGSVSSDD